MSSIKNIEGKMEGLDRASIRYRVLENAKNFKTSWIELGRSLYSVWKDKLYKEWGYASFDVYTAREIGIRKLTAMKLLRSYYFLEKEEPQYLKKEYVESAQASSVPAYESVDLLRLAKGKKNIDENDYADLKREVFEEGRGPLEVKKNLAVMIRQRQELEPEEAQAQKRISTVKRLVGTLKLIKKEVELLKLLPASDIREVAKLISKLEVEISSPSAGNQGR